MIIILLRFRINIQDNFFPLRGVVLIDFVLSFMWLASVRLAIRLYRQGAIHSRNVKYTKLKKVGIVGARHSGANLVKDLFVRKRLGVEPK
jgi:FlaA1/EpsC-like NDP-sugar epimerase